MSKEQEEDTEQPLKDQKLDTEDEHELFGPSSEDEGGHEREEGQEARRLSRPQQPSKEAILQQELTHIPFRSWCPPPTTPHPTPTV